VKKRRTTITPQSNNLPNLKVALDAGFHSFKGAFVLEGKVHTVALPAVVGLGETDLGLLQPGLTRQKRQLPFLVVVDEQRYLVGPFVNQYTRPTERLDFDRLSQAPELRALTYTILGQIVQKAAHVLGLPMAGNPIEINLIAALPVQVLQGPEARAVVGALESWLLGEHHFELEGLPFHVYVPALKAMAQPLGSFFEWGLGLNGQWERSPFDLKASVAVLDQGFNTLDLFHLSGGQIVRRYTGGETLGQRRAAKIMQDLVLQKAGRRASLHEADTYVRQVCNGQRAELIVKGERVDLKPLARQALDAATGEVRAYLSQTWEDGKVFDYVLLTGGGSLAIGDRLRAIFPNAIELPDPVTANARGLAKFAQRFGVFEPVARPNQVA